MNKSKYFRYTQTVTNKTLDAICDRYVNAGWIEVDVIGETNQVKAVVFEWRHDYPKLFPSLSDL